MLYYCQVKAQDPCSASLSMWVGLCVAAGWQWSYSLLRSTDIVFPGGQGGSYSFHQAPSATTPVGLGTVSVYYAEMESSSPCPHPIQEVRASLASSGSDSHGLF